MRCLGFRVTPLWLGHIGEGQGPEVQSSHHSTIVGVVSIFWQHTQLYRCTPESREGSRESGGACLPGVTTGWGYPSAGLGCQGPQWVKP